MNTPRINLTHLAYITHYTSLIRRWHIGFLLNRNTAGSTPTGGCYFTYISKADEQANNIADTTMELYVKLKDFAEDNFATYIEVFHDTQGTEATFSPYAELRNTLKQKDIYALPESIERYSELLDFTRNYSDLQNKKRNLYQEMSPGRPEMITFINDMGFVEYASAEDIPANELAGMQLNSQIEDIEIDYCLDSYDEWYSTISRMIREEAPYEEMLKLFRS